MTFRSNPIEWVRTRWWELKHIGKPKPLPYHSDLDLLPPLPALPFATAPATPVAPTPTTEEVTPTFTGTLGQCLDYLLDTPPHHYLVTPMNGDGSFERYSLPTYMAVLDVTGEEDFSGDIVPADDGTYLLRSWVGADKLPLAILEPLEESNE